MIRSNLCHFGDAYIHLEGTITVTNVGTAGAADNRNKKIITKNCASFNDWISEINNTPAFDSHDIDVVMHMFNRHCVNSVRIQSFSGPYFPAFGLNPERHGVSLCIQSKCRKIRTRKIPNTDTFHAVRI